MARTHDPDEILATISASLPRRWLGVGSIALLGVLLIYMALARPPAPGWALFLIALGGGALLLAVRMQAATARVLTLTRSALHDDTGQVIARVAEIEAVDRGFFAFKPSSGFLLRTRTPAGPRAWHPGMWWRAGRQIGVGGVTRGGQAKFASEMISVLIAERDGQV